MGCVWIGTRGCATHSLASSFLTLSPPLSLSFYLFLLPFANLLFYRSYAHISSVSAFPVPSILPLNRPPFSAFDPSYSAEMRSTRFMDEGDPRNSAAEELPISDTRADAYTRTSGTRLGIYRRRSMRLRERDNPMRDKMALLRKHAKDDRSILNMDSRICTSLKSSSQERIDIKGKSSFTVVFFFTFFLTNPFPCSCLHEISNDSQYSLVLFFILYIYSLF